MLCNIGFHTDCTYGKSAIQFKHLKSLKFDTPIAICDNGNISQLIKALGLNKNNIPAVELAIVASYEEQRYPAAFVRIFAFDNIAYKAMCNMITKAGQNKKYVPRLKIEDLQAEGDIIFIATPDFLFLDNMPYEKTFIAVNANVDLHHSAYIRYRPIFYYDSYTLYEKDLKRVEILSARNFKHNDKVWYYDESHYDAAKSIPESIYNYETLLAKATKPVIEFKNRYPKFCENSEDYFEALVDAGFQRKYRNPTKVHYERLQYEKAVIKKAGYCDYFIINWDFIHWARTNNIPIGPGRGSAAGSMVAYCLDITKLDPLSNSLYFERFLNPDRISPPDIDTDINTDDRKLVMDYIKERYGEQYVSKIVTFGELKSKSALKDAARLHDVDAFEVNRITSYFPPSKFGVPPTLEEAFQVESVREWANDHKQIWEEAKSIEGFIRQTGIHAAGMIIAPEPISDISGVSFTDNERICQFDKNDSEKFGLLKMDFLGLATLGLIKEIQKLLGKSYYDMESIPLDDEAVYAAFAKGDTHGIFQFESEGMAKLLKRIIPRSFADISAATALYRPGPLTAGLTDQYVVNKNSINPEYFLPEFEELLKETYGVMVYQEQIMLVAQTICGFTLARADILRKAIGKKDKELMRTMEVEFVEGAVSNGFARSRIQDLWKQIVGFADYCFNKSHAYAYSLVSYWTMFLKVHYPKEFAVCLLSSDIKDSSKLRSHFFAFKDSVRFLPPFINSAGNNFRLHNDGVMIGFGAIKGMGNSAGSLEANQPYAEIVDVVLKNKLDKSQLETLIYSGAFEDFEKDKSILLGNVERLTSFSRSNAGSDIFNLFDPVDLFSLNLNKKKFPPSDGAMEKTCYGFNIYHGFIGKNKWLLDCLDQNIVIGPVSDIKRTKVKKTGKDMAILTVDSVRGQYKVLLFAEKYAKFGLQIEKESTYAFKGELKYTQNLDGEEEASLFMSDMLTEPMIVVSRVDLMSREKRDVKIIDQILSDHFIKNGIGEINLYQTDLDGGLIFLGKYPKKIYFDEKMYQSFVKAGFDIKLDIF